MNFWWGETMIWSLFVERNVAGTSVELSMSRAHAPIIALCILLSTRLLSGIFLIELIGDRAHLEQCLAKMHMEPALVDRVPGLLREGDEQKGADPSRVAPLC